MEIEKLFNFTLMSLALLIDRYNAGKMEYGEFCSHVSIKIQFLKDNVENIKQADKKKAAEEILQHCNRILKQQ